MYLAPQSTSLTLPLPLHHHHYTSFYRTEYLPQVLEDVTPFYTTEYQPQVLEDDEEINNYDDEINNYNDEINNHSEVVMVSWKFPPFGTYTLNTDGCSKGNPGESGSGGIIRDFTGTFVAGFSFRIRFHCAAYAEIWALYQGLKLAQKTTGIADLIIECDSIEVVSVILGQHGKTYKYVDIVDWCRRMLTSFNNVSIRHVYREANQCADYLANKSLSLDHMGLKEWNNIQDMHLMSLVHSDQMGTATPRICKGLCKPRFYM